MIAIIFIILIVPLVHFVIEQLKALVMNFPKYLRQSATLFGIDLNIKQIQGYLDGQGNVISSNALQVTSTVFGGIFSLITVFIVSLYLFLFNYSFKKNFSILFHRQHKEKVLMTVDLVNEKLGAWLQGQMLLSLSIGVLTWIALMLLGIPFALPLALLAGLLEVVPTLGPTLAAIPAVVVALTISPTFAVVIIFTYILIQMLENQLFVPKIMERAVGLNPIIVIIGVTIGA